ncbi:MAG: hypothetical protein PHQ04_01535 [Opitutaceae bacterium]|nr:hypothetical protein [Opitutaceae bacterium]
MNTMLRTYMLACLLWPASWVWAQVDKKTEMTAPAPANDAIAQQWAALKNLAAPQSVAKEAKVQVAAGYIQQADKYKDFYTQYSQRPEAKEAECSEALALLYAARYDSTAQKERRDQAVKGVRSDTTIPLSKRFEIAAIADHFTARQQQGQKMADRLSAYEKVERGLISEFPDVPYGFEALLHVAEWSSDDIAARLAQELTDNKDTPAYVEKGARVLATRCTFVGRPLLDPLRPAVGAVITPESIRGQKVILYTWAAGNSSSLGLAQAIIKQAPPDAKLIGVNLDTDVSAAKAAAQKAKLPDLQLYNERGCESPLAKQLNLTTAPLVYLVDRNGLVLSVSAQRDLKATLASLAAL